MHKPYEESLSTSKTSTTSGSINPESCELILDQNKMYAAEWKAGEAFPFALSSVNSDQGPVLLLTRRLCESSDLIPSGLGRLVPGDVLVSIDNHLVFCLPLADVMQRLKCPQNPVRLVLQLSPYGQMTEHSLPALAPNEYNYHWEDGPLGIVLTCDPSMGIPIVKRVNLNEMAMSIHQNRSLLQKISVGDALIYVNAFPTCEYGMRATIDKIKTLQKPIVLRFRKPLQNANVELPVLKENEYDILWEYGSLGIVMGTSRQGIPFVRSFTGKGVLTQLRKVSVGDELVLVNDQIAKINGFDDIMSYLRNVPKPAVLRFRRAVQSDGESKEGPSEPLHTYPEKNFDKKLNVLQYKKVISISQKSGKGEIAQEINAYNDQTMAIRQRKPINQPPMQGIIKHSAPTNGYRSRAACYSSQNEYATAPEQSLKPADNRFAQSFDRLPKSNCRASDPISQHQFSSNRSSRLTEELYDLDASAFYVIQWTDGPFGFMVREAQTVNGTVMLVTKRTNKSTCAGLRRVAPGDLLVKIGSRIVSSFSFRDAATYLKKVSKPVSLTFQAVS